LNTLFADDRIADIMTQAGIGKGKISGGVSGAMAWRTLLFANFSKELSPAEIRYLCNAASGPIIPPGGFNPN
jgi:hypothetical protein